MKKLSLLLCANIGAASLAMAPFEGTFRFMSRYGYHTMDPYDLATHRHLADVGAKFALGQWQLVTGARAFVDSAFATNANYPTTVGREYSQDIRFRDLYLQYRNSWLQVRLGNQQVVWGEAFGSYYADIVNPKDLRDFGLGNLEFQRLPTPIINVKLLTEKYSLQGIYVVKPCFHLMPPQGSDFAFPYGRYVPGAAVTLTTDTDPTVNLQNAEYGGRLTALVGTTDLSLFYFSYFDRMPVYSMRVTSVTPFEVALDPSHPRIQTTGVTLTHDFSNFLIRFEGLYTQNRQFGASQAGTIATTPSDELEGVLGVDLTRFEKWRVGFQASADHLLKDIPGCFRNRTKESLSLSVGGPLWLDHTIDIIATYLPHDGSSLLRLTYQAPLGAQLEWGVTADTLLGSSLSELGQFRAGSRVYFFLKGYLNI